eukprot:4488363-Prorocentrum_lima.AAC.1
MTSSLVGSEMCIRDSCRAASCAHLKTSIRGGGGLHPELTSPPGRTSRACLLYTSDAADDM